MAKFTPNEFSVQGEPQPKASGEPGIMKLDNSPRKVVQDFAFPKLDGKHVHGYAEAKSRYGSLAVTDPEHSGKAQRDRRFALNPLLRGPLSVDEEEQRVLADRVEERVKAMADQARQEAAQAGYQDGLKQGHAEAFARFKAEASARLEGFEQLVAELEAAKAEIFRANERFLVEMVYRIGRMVTLKELSTDKDYVLRLARELVERVGVRENIRIRINPAEAQSIGMLKEGLESSLGALKNLNIEASSQVQRGGCVLETEWNAIDASIETQLQGICDALIGKRTGSDQ